MALTLCGCASLGSDPRPAPLAREIPATCEKILEEVPFPPAAPADDARVAFMRGDAALITANERIRGGRGCVAAVRRGFAAPSKP